MAQKGRFFHYFGAKESPYVLRPGAKGRLSTQALATLGQHAFESVDQAPAAPGYQITWDVFVPVTVPDAMRRGNRGSSAPPFSEAVYTSSSVFPQKRQRTARQARRLRRFPRRNASVPRDFGRQSSKRGEDLLKQILDLVVQNRLLALILALGRQLLIGDYVPKAEVFI